MKQGNTRTRPPSLSAILLGPRQALALAMETGLSAQQPKATWGGWWGTQESVGPTHGRVWSSETEEGGKDSSQRASPGAIQTHVNSSWEPTKEWLVRVSSLEQWDPNLASQRLIGGRFRENTCSPATPTPKHSLVV